MLFASMMSRLTGFLLLASFPMILATLGDSPLASLLIKLRLVCTPELARHKIPDLAPLFEC